MHALKKNAWHDCYIGNKVVTSIRSRTLLCNNGRIRDHTYLPPTIIELGVCLSVTMAELGGTPFDNRAYFKYFNSTNDGMAITPWENQYPCHI